jgi:DNA-binding response OmpR family regulator
MSRPIVIVEDDPDLREELRDALEAEGFDIHVAADGREALYLLVDLGGKAVVLLDLMMPVLSGWEMLEWLRRIGSGATVIVLSAVGDAASVPGVAAYVSKPVSLGVLIPLLHMHTAGSGP